MLHLAERRHVAGILLIVLHIRLEYQGKYLLLLSFPQRKMANNLATQKSAPHINLWAVTFDFHSNVWVFSSPNSCIMFVKLVLHI